MDLSKLSDEDLQAISAGDMTKVSDAGLATISGTEASAQPAPPTITDRVKRELGLTMHAIVGAITGLPALVVDKGFVEPYNKQMKTMDAFAGQKSTAEQMPTASQSVRYYEDKAGIPQPQGLSEHVGDFGAQMLAGGMLPNLPLPQSNVPSNFVRPLPEKLVAQKAAQEAGYVAPPATTNPTTLNRVLEGALAGKKGAEHTATAMNNEVTQTLAKKALGLHPDVPLNKEALTHIFEENDAARQAIANAGFMMKPDKWYERALDDITARSQKAGGFAEVLKDTNLEKTINGLKQVPDQFKAEDALASVQQLRALKSDAYAQGNTTLGDAYRKASDAIENLIQRNLERKANIDLTKATGSPDTLKASKEAASALARFKDARKLMAKAYEVERAMNPATGEVNAQKLARSPNAGAFTDGLDKIRDAANTFPKVTGPVRDSGAVSQLEAPVSAAASAAMHGSAAAGFGGVPLLRDLARSWMLSPRGQNLLAQPPSTVTTAEPNPDMAQGVATGVASLFNNQ